MNKILILLIFGALLCACGRKRTEITNGYYYSSIENNKIDGMASVDLEYSETGRTFITIERNLYASAGGVVVHNRVAVFCVRGSSVADTEVFAATPTVKSVSIAPVIEKKWNELPISKVVHWKKDYFILKIAGTAEALSLRIAQRKYVADFPETVTLDVKWSDIASLLQGE